MKSLLLTTLALGAVAIPSVAQNKLFNNPDNKAYFGVRVAGEVTCPGKYTYKGFSEKIYNNGGGIEFGGIYNIPVVANFYVEPGVKLFYNAYGVNTDNDYDDDDYYYDDDDDDYKASIRKFGLRIPVMLGYHFDFTDDIKVSVFTGPEFEAGLSGKFHVSEDGESESESIYGDKGFMNRVDLTWGFGAGVTYKKFYFGISGNVGMLNMLKDSDGVKFHENRASFTLGYNF